MRAAQLLGLLVVEHPVLAADAVRDHAEPAAREVRLEPVAQVAAGAQVHAEDRVARLEQREEDRLVRLRPGVRLEVRVAAAEQLARALDRERLDRVEVDRPRVIAASGVALHGREGEDRAQRLAGGAAHVVLRRDQLDLVALAALLPPDRLRDRGIARREVVSVEPARPRRSGAKALLTRRCGHGSHPA